MQLERYQQQLHGYYTGSASVATHLYTADLIHTADIDEFYDTYVDV